jgi:uncharacterized protein YukE
MAFGGDVVHYNYAAMHGIADQIHAGAMKAQALLEAARSHKTQMLATFHGSAADTAQTCLATYEQAATDMIEVASRGGMNYAEGTSSMQAAEAAQAQAFP